MPKAYELPAPGEPFDPEIFKLGQPCKRNHIHADGFTLRWRKHKTCCLCARIDSYERQQRLRQDPEYNRKRAEYIAEKRKREGRPSRAKHSDGWHSLRRLHAAIKRAGKYPTVSQLVRQEQLRHWREHPADRAQYLKDEAIRKSRWLFMTSLEHRLYHRAKSKARKVAQRGGTPHHLSPTQLWRRWCDFDHSCAYCGASGDLEVEHVVPISKGGEHHLGNIVPACHRCNSSKLSKDAWSWYKAQPFYEDWRWHNIKSILNKSKPMTQQINLFAC
jgi:5-methylcytosine-specific restriction endonuclease McrA